MFGKDEKEPCNCCFCRYQRLQEKQRLIRRGIIPREEAPSLRNEQSPQEKDPES